MSDEPNGDESNNRGGSLRDKRREGFITYVRRKMHERRAKREAEQPAERYARKTTNATIWMAIFTVILAGAAVKGIWISEDTLIQLKSGDKATSEALDAAKRSASAAKDSAAAAVIIAAANQQANNILTAQERDIARLAYSAQVSNDLSKSKAENDRRARIAIGGASSRGVSGSGTGWNLHVLFKNTGREPATNFTEHASVLSFIGDWAGNPQGAQRVGRELAYCKGISATGTATIPPDYPYESINTFTSSESFRAVANGTGTVVAAGCLAYRTIGTIFRAPFCYYFRAGKAGENDETNWSACPIGNGPEQ